MPLVPGIAKIEEDYNGRGSTNETDSRGLRVRTYKRRFYAILLHPGIDPMAVLADSRLPADLAFYQSPTFFDNYARCVKRTPNQVSAFRVDVELEYTTKWADVLSSGAAVTNPLLMAPKISYGSRDYQKPCEEDFSDTPQTCTNSSREPFDPPLISDAAAPTIRVTLNRPWYPLEWEEYLDPKAVNDDMFMGRDPGTVKINSMAGGDLQNEGGIAYMPVTLEFFVKKTGWDNEPLDQGFSKLTAGAFRRQVPIIEAGGIPPKPRLLDGDGNVLASGGTPVFLDGDAGRKGPFRTQPRRPFSVFGIT